MLAVRLEKGEGGTSGMLDELYKGENEQLKPLYRIVEKFVLNLDEKISLNEEGKIIL
ncbi:MAG: hypothetical protein KTR26_15525 [Flammeovirgaceae bacterium]|nr:hypothetical protein [Flammeovirgaceae bacterium]